jgi:hypothetical protein
MISILTEYRSKKEKDIEFKKRNFLGIQNLEKYKKEPVLFPLT